jgi:glyoxylase-like metal-dependent hydrolase (beta-lactamase superfamily II)
MSAETLVAVADWFVVEDVGEGVTKLTEPHVSDLVSANLWWIKGRRHDVLVDTGLGVASLRQHLPEVLEHDTLAVISHTHLDHAGGAHEFGRVAVHPLEARSVSTPPPASLDPRTELELLGLAPPGSLPGSLLKALPEPGYDPAAYAVRPAAVTRTLDDGDVIDLGDRRLRVIHAPGHTPGSILLLDEIDGADIPSYVASMRRMRDLEVAMIHPGHDRSFDGDRMRELVDAYLELRGGH